MAAGKRLFTFAVIADTHVNQEEGKASSDFAVNRLANARNRYVLSQLGAANPAFVLHLGDIVHPTPQHEGYAQAAGAFHALAGVLRCPLYLTPGNHDVGDKPGDWLPVPSVNPEYLALYERHFGKRHYAFGSHGCRFLVIDAQVINSGLPAEAEQRRWFEAELDGAKGQRLFLSLHYPPFLHHPAEGGHYDNLDEPGRSWLLALLRKHRVEAVFAGHVHNFWYHVHGETDFYLLPSTAFVRLDYSEMARVAPGPERGRNDAPKLGYLMVDVHERGHAAHPVRSWGLCQLPGEPGPGPAPRPPPHPVLGRPQPVGIDLRQPWAEVTEVAASGALDEFARKAVRNDYPVMALWELGIRRLRVPFGDLVDPATRERMQALRRAGHVFVVYSHGLPQAAEALLLGHPGLVSEWEVVAPLAGLAESVGSVAALRRRCSLEFRFSPLRRPGDSVHHGLKTRHVIEHGFLVQEEAHIARVLESDAGVRKAFDGFVIRVPRAQAASEALRRVGAFSARMGTRDCAYVRMAADNPAEAQDDDLANANRACETVFAAFAAGGAKAPAVWLDTLADVDRGYYPRTGMVDRLYNPRLAGRACSRLVAELCGAEGLVLGAEHASDVGRLLLAHTAREQWGLWLPKHPGQLVALPAGTPLALVRTCADVLDLGTAASSRVRLVPGLGQGVQLDCPLAHDGPVLMRAASA